LALLPANRKREETLRSIHLDALAPSDVAAAAMYARAVTFEERGDWDEAFSLYWRMCQRYADTAPALAAPLHVVRTLLEMGSRSQARQALERASSFYLRVITDDSALLEPRHAPMDHLVESWCLIGEPETAARLLETRSSAWSSESGAVASYKSALIYEYMLGDAEKAVDILEKTLEQSRGSRYASSVRRELDRAREARVGRR
jgi:tetratricopeptide (TPR) repeat protein